MPSSAVPLQSSSSPLQTSAPGIDGSVSLQSSSMPAEQIGTASPSWLMPSSSALQPVATVAQVMRKIDGSGPRNIGVSPTPFSREIPASSGLHSSSSSLVTST